jgi:taurine--2-oxoglutarate transaminase
MQVMNQVTARLKEQGIYTFFRWNYIFIAPPLTMALK